LLKGTNDSLIESQQLVVSKRAFLGVKPFNGIALYLPFDSPTLKQINTRLATRIQAP
jgi:hypothetical protein